MSPTKDGNERGTSITADNIRAVRDLIEEDRRVTISDIASHVGISFGSVQAIISDELKFRKLSARWVPRLLSQEQTNLRQEVSQRHLSRYEEEGDDFLNRIVTSDETWVHHYTPESKRSSMEWRKRGAAGPVKAKTRLSAGKVLATVFWDSEGVLLVDFRRKPIRNVIVLHDNARPHTARLTQEKLTQMHWTPLEHPPYSPDLSPCDYHLFGPLKEDLGGRRFGDNAAVEEFVRNWLTTRHPSFFKDGIKKLPAFPTHFCHRVGTLLPSSFHFSFQSTLTPS